MLISTENLKQSTQPSPSATETRLWPKQKGNKDRISNDITTGQKILNELQKFEYRLYIYSSSSIQYKNII